MVETASEDFADRLRRDLTDEIAVALGFSSKGLARKIIGPIVHLPARRFAEWLAEFDRLVTEKGTRDAAQALLARLVAGVRAHGVDRVPSEGPLIFACNHPGAVDGLAALSQMPRGDIKVFATGQPILRRFPCGKQHVIYVPRPGEGERMKPVREAIRHMETGGSVLIMPGGHVEPDPAILPGAREDLGGWSPSLELLLRRVPESRLQVTIISGVLEPRWLRHPLVRRRRGNREKQLLAEFLMIIRQALLRRREPLVPDVTFGQPVTAAQLQPNGTSGPLMPALIEHARSVLDEHMARIGAAASGELGQLTMARAGL